MNAIDLKIYFYKNKYANQIKLELNLPSNVHL